MRKAADCCTGFRWPKLVSSLGELRVPQAMETYGNNNVQLAFICFPCFPENTENKGVFSVKLVEACHMMPQYILGICVPTCQLRSGHCQWAWNSFIPGHPSMMTAYANKVTPSFPVGNAMGYGSYGSAKNINK